MSAAHRWPEHARLERLLAAGAVLLVLPALLSAATWRVLAQPEAAAALALLAIGAGFALRESRDEPRPLQWSALILFVVFVTLFAAAALRFVARLAVFDG